MKNKAVRIIISALLCAVTALSLPVCAVCASTSKYPLIYVAGVEESVLYKNPNKANATVKFGVNSTSFISSCTNIAAALLLNESGAPGVVTKEINNIFADIKCNEKGYSADSTVGTYSYTLPLSEYQDDEINTDTLRAIIKNSNGKLTEKNVFVFTCDWRLSPLDTAVKLKKYVDSVLSYTNAKKVNLLCGGFGGTVGASYLYKYPIYAANRVNSVTFVDCPLWGNANIGDLMSGQLYQTVGDAHSLADLVDKIGGTTRGTAFLNYCDQDPDGFFTDIAEAFLGSGTTSTIIQYGIKLIIGEVSSAENLDRKLGKSYNDFLVSNQESIYDSVLTEALKNMPGLWAMVPEEYFDDAIDFMFGTEIINSTLYDKITSYRKNVMNNIDSVLSNAKVLGIKTNVVVNYGIQNIPLTCSLESESDSMLTTRHASAGATTVECGQGWEGCSNCTNKYHNHIVYDKSGDAVIDASSCALPENTWFIDGLAHLDFSCDTAATFLNWLINSKTQRTVWDNSNYTQFMSYTKSSKSISATATDTSTVTAYTYGDFNFDGKVTAVDSRAVLRYAIGLDTNSSKYRIAVGDVDGNGYIDTLDARLILRYALNKINIFPAEEN